MSEANEVAALLQRLEEQLLRPEVRASPDQVSRLLADDFMEFGSSGRAYDKAEVMVGLAAEQPLPAGLRILASHFEMKILAAGVALVTYRTARPVPGADPARSRRSSIWKLMDGRWQMVFHQGTPLKIEETS
jgi:hypothetical protein